MIEAVLLDLDNTLIHNPDHQFALAFMQCIDEHFQKYLGVKDISSGFRKGIKALSSQIHRNTNTKVMIETLVDETQLSLGKIQETYQSFYVESYPTLQHHVSPVAKATNLIEYLFEHDMSLIIATNPLYPTIAIQQRLVWAGLEKYLDNFTLVTSSDNMHTCKPNIGYYSEILDRIKLPAKQCLMIGDSLRNDIKPAKQLSMQTYHIADTSDLPKFIEHVQQILEKQTKN